MKRGLCVAFLAAVILTLATPLVAAKTSVYQLGGMPVVGPVVSIQVPLLTKTVTIDGKLEHDEWSDTIENDLTLKCTSTNCGTAPVSSLQGKAWLKHDNTWLYYLFQTGYTPPSGAPADRTSSGLEYWWGIDGNKYDYHNYYNVCPGLCFGEGFYDGQKHVSDPNSNMFQPPVAEGFGTFGENHYTFELKVLLNSSQKFHWNLAPAKTYGVPRSDGIMFLYFNGLCVPRGSSCGTYSNGEPATWDYYRSVTLSLLTTAIAVPNTVSSSTAQASTTETESLSSKAISSTTTMTGEIVGQTQFGGIWLLLPVAAIIAVASIFLVVRRRSTTRTASVTEQPAKASVPTSSVEPSIPTGYGELDRMLAGGLPEGYAVALVSQSYDERDLLVRKIVQSSLVSGRPTFYLSNDIARTRDLTTRFSQNFFALSPMAEKIASDRPNLYRIPDVGDLSSLNISIHEIIESKSGSAGAS